MKMSKEIKIALVAVVGILIMYFGINFLKGINLFSSHNYYYITFNDIQGFDQVEAYKMVEVPR